jgi:hypothetical protein
MAKAVGVGGIFLKAQDPEALTCWYANHLGIPEQEGGSLAFDGPESSGMTVFAHFPPDAKYFGSGGQSFMVNFRVDDLDQLLVQLAAAAVRIARSARTTPTADSRGFGILRVTGWSCGSRSRRAQAQSRVEARPSLRGGSE